MHEPSADYPLGGMIEPYDIEREKSIFERLFDEHHPQNPEWHTHHFELDHGEPLVTNAKLEVNADGVWEINGELTEAGKKFFEGKY